MDFMHALSVCAVMTVMLCLLQVQQLQGEVEKLWSGDAALVAVLNDVGRQSVLRTWLVRSCR